MTKTFKYTTEDKFNEFYENVHSNIDTNPIEQIYETEQLNLMITMRYKPDSWTDERALSVIENLLYLFEDYEEYETCQTIVNSWPELIRNENLTIC